MNNITPEQLTQIIISAINSMPKESEAGLTSGDWIALLSFGAVLIGGLISLVFWVGTIKTTIDGLIVKNKEQDKAIEAIEKSDKEQRSQLKADIEKEFDRNYGQHEDFYARDKVTTSKVDTMSETLRHIVSGIDEIKEDLKDMRKGRV